jgi:hypothetical protein
MAAIAPAAVNNQKRIHPLEPVKFEPLAKRPRHLNYEKCSFCRKDKKGVGSPEWFFSATRLIE